MTTLPAVARPAPRSSLRDWLARRPLLSYFVLAFTPMWLALLPVVMARNGLGLFPFTVSDGAFVLLFIGSILMGPTLGAFLVTWAAEGRAGVGRFLRRYIQWRIGIQWYVLALFGYLALYLIGAMVWMGSAAPASFAANWQVLFTSYPLLLLAMIIFPALIEEPGWRGFALPRLQAHYGPLAGALILGLLHGLWHLPVYFLVSGPAAMGPFDLSQVVINTLTIMLLTITWTWVFNKANASILIAILLHAASNASDKVFPALVPHIPEQMRVTMFAIHLAVVLLIIVGTRGRLGYRPDTSTRDE